jgi:hypothetical protein
LFSLQGDITMAIFGLFKKKFDAKESLLVMTEMIDKMERFSKQSLPIIEATTENTKDIHALIEKIKKDPTQFNKNMSVLKDDINNIFRGDIRDKKYAYTLHKVFESMSDKANSDKYTEKVLNLIAKGKEALTEVEKEIGMLYQLDRFIRGELIALRQNVSNPVKFSQELEEFDKKLKKDQDLHKMNWRATRDLIHILEQLKIEMHVISEKLGLAA